MNTSIRSADCSPNNESEIYQLELGSLARLVVKKGHIKKELVGHKDAINEALFSPNRKYIVSTSWDSSTRLWNTENGEQMILLNDGNERIF